MSSTFLLILPLVLISVTEYRLDKYVWLDFLYKCWFSVEKLVKKGEIVVKN